MIVVLIVVAVLVLSIILKVKLPKLITERQLKHSLVEMLDLLQQFDEYLSENSEDSRDEGLVLAYQEEINQYDSEVYRLCAKLRGQLPFLHRQLMQEIGATISKIDSLDYLLCQD